MAAYNAPDLRAARDSMAAKPPCFFIHFNTLPNM